MLILSLKPGHDGCAAAVLDGKLLFSIEAEKDSYQRYSQLNPSTFIKALGMLPGLPDVICESGWIKGDFVFEPPSGAGYFGFDDSSCNFQTGQIANRSVIQFSSSHERSHIFCSFGLSPFPQGTPCYVLIWEGILGDFYLLRSDLSIEHLGRVIDEPGNKFSFPYYIAHSDRGLFFSNDWAGKVMALAAFGETGVPNEEEKEFIEYMLHKFSWGRTWRADFEKSPFLGIGVEDQLFKNLVRKLSDRIFSLFEVYARKNLKQKYPLLIGGGCGLNCEWNSRWKETGLFEDVFIPPCTNDSGSALGTAIDAQRAMTGNAKIEWSVYAGEEFQFDTDLTPKYIAKPLCFIEVANHLLEGKILGWVQGRYEMGPRALGHRSILASPFDSSMCMRLNRIKQREFYRPIGPVCLEEEVHRHFCWNEASDYMLFFQKVRNTRLKAVTHVDGSARVQTVNQSNVPKLAGLLREFGKISGASVLCNTSLNFPGKGFINRLSDLAKFQTERGLDGFIVGDIYFVPREGQI
jgi:predicted NodU family carbamoyl transferase